MMDRNTDNFTLINRYLNDEMAESEVRDLEKELQTNPALAAELKFHLEVEEALQEKEVTCLRENINKIMQEEKPAINEEELILSETYRFGLAEELSTINEFKASLKFDDILNFNHSFPKIHLYQHLVAAKENIYQFYKEQQEQAHPMDFELPTPLLEEELFNDIQDAITENDVLDLRANLNQIASSVALHSYSSSDIHEYVDGTMDLEQRSRFEDDLKFDKNLENEVNLYREVDLAIAESDIMSLRASLQEIQSSDHIISSGIEEIEGYLYNELSDKQMALFEDELIGNHALSAEIELIRGIDQAIQEEDIMQLRTNLGQIAEENNKKKQKEQSLTGRFRHRKLAISVVAASLILLLGITGVMRQMSDNDVYQNYYSKYEKLGVSRSSDSKSDQTFAMALQKYNKKDYESALILLQEVQSKDQNNIASHFYSGASLQEMGKYKKAIKEYEFVVIDRDNLFIEQAEWYIGLCYLQTNEEKKAIQQFKKIADSNGFYQQKAVAILRKLKNNI